MKLVICCNHSFPHVGGSERVIHQIGSALSLRGWQVVTLSRSLKTDTIIDGVSYLPCANDPKAFLNQLSVLQPNYTLVYSDCFHHWSEMLNKFESLPGAIGIAPVGMNFMLQQKASMRKFVSLKGRMDIICHSNNYQDYDACRQYGLTAEVIPNGVSLSEFKKADWSFRDKYGITTDKMILCVSNFFPGKGQEHLVRILNLLAKKRNDFTAVFLSTSVNFLFAQTLSDRVRTSLLKEPYPSVFLTDLSREDTIQAFFAADLFAFPTQKEVAPLVVIESQASNLPWVALPVGNIPQLSGGRIVQFRAKDYRGYAKYDLSTYQLFSSAIDELLSNCEVAKELAKAGREQVEQVYNWDAIADRYMKLLERRVNGSQN